MMLRTGVISLLALAIPLGCQPAKTKEAAPAASAGTAAPEETHEPAAKPKEPEPAAASALDSIRQYISGKGIDTSSPGWRTKVQQPAKATFSGGAAYFWNLDTSEGDVRVRLMPDVAPMHVTSTIYLTELGFYDGLAFHRVIPGFMAQGGCPLGNGSGGPGYKYASEIAPSVKHDRPGLLSMANTGMPSTDGSQFFLTFAPTPWLDGKHTIFGEVVGGMDVLKKLESFGSAPGGQTSKPLSIEKATISVE
jgi:cyclophilin family peptidyl-prolyl cis-trans isomerase